MKNLKIGVKLLITFLLIIVMFCITVFMSIRGLNENAEKYSEFYNVGYKITNKVMSMRRGLQIIEKDLAFITMEEDAEEAKDYHADMDKELDLLSENGDWLFSNFTGDATLLEAFSKKITKAVELQQTVLETAQSDRMAAQDMLLEQYQPLVDEAVDALIHISEVAEQSADADYNETVALQKELVYLQFGLAGGALFITLVLSFYLTGAITKPIRQLERSAEKIVKGDFNISITYKSRDEMGMLADAFRNMTQILEEIGRAHV